MNVQEFYALVDKTNSPDKAMSEELKLLVGKYPYFQAGIFIYLKSLYISPSEESFSSELQRLSPFILDRKALFYYVFSEQYSRFQKERGKNELDKDRTSVLLDAFFESMEQSPKGKQLEYSINNASMASLDYFSFLESAESLKKEGKTEVKMRHQDVIDDFISKAEEDGSSLKIKLSKEHSAEDDNLPKPPPSEISYDDDDIFFSETLANIYIKQRKFQKAYEIIERLSLNYPEKNIYFADQLAFLEKLIINSQKNK